MNNVNRNRYMEDSDDRERSGYRLGQDRGQSGYDRTDRYDEHRTRGYDPGQGSDYHESGLRSFDYTDYRSRDRYDRNDDRSSEQGRSDRRDRDERERSNRDDRGRSDLSHRDRRDDERSDLRRSEDRNSSNHDISGTWRQFNAWGRESYGDQRGQGIGYHRHDSFHDDFWSQDEGPRERG
jgi:hypothetical protein